MNWKEGKKRAWKGRVQGLVEEDPIPLGIFKLHCFYCFNAHHPHYNCCHAPLLAQAGHVDRCHILAHNDWLSMSAQWANERVVQFHPHLIFCSGVQGPGTIPLLSSRTWGLFYPEGWNHSPTSTPGRQHSWLKEGGEEGNKE